MTIPPRVQALADELDHLIESAINNAPRSLQTRIGPSELGIPCDLRLGYKMAGHPTVNDGQPLSWKAWIGTNVHTGLQELLTRANMALPNWAVDGRDRYLVEERVTVGHVNGDDVNGNADLYLDGVVWDWKIPGGNTLRKYKKEGPGDQYRIQAHLYGRGWELRGYPVEHVAIYFLPRDQEWKQRHLWSEPYDRTIAENALSRVDGIAKLVQALGANAFPLLTRRESWCRSCPWFRPGATDLATGCGGDPETVTAATSELFDLIAQ